MTGPTPTPPTAGPGRWLLLGLLALVVASFWSLDLQWAQFFSLAALHSMGRFVAEFFPPDLSPAFLRKVRAGTLETLAMSVLGTALAAAAGLLLAGPASSTADGSGGAIGGATARGLRTLTRWLLNVLRAIPELIIVVGSPTPKAAIGSDGQRVPHHRDEGRPCSMFSDLSGAAVIDVGVIPKSAVGAAPPSPQRAIRFQGD